jgi:hypothetical protein
MSLNCQSCEPVVIENHYCPTGVYDQVGEGKDMILIPTKILQRFLLKNSLLLVDSPALPTVINCGTIGGAIPKYTYDQPVTTPSDLPTIASALFPDGVNIEGMYFFGGIGMFNPENGFGKTAEGYPYGTSKVSIRFGADRFSPDMVAYIQSQQWNVLKLSQDANTIFVYGGKSGMTANADEVVTFQFSGMNEESGSSVLTLEQKKTGAAITYINKGLLTTTPSNALETLFEAFQLKATMPQAV